jgi:hypothetical protein
VLAIALLLAAVTPTSTPTPAPAGPAPTRVTVDSNRPRTLADVARERRGRSKPQGSVSAAEGTLPRDTPSDRIAVLPAAGAPAVRIAASHHEPIDGDGHVRFSGSVQNPGAVAACGVHVIYRVYDDHGKPIGTGEASTQPAQIGPGQEAAFHGWVSMPPGVFNPENRVSAGDPNVEIRYLGRGDAAVVSSEPCR